MSNIFASELFWRIAIPITTWYLMPAFFNVLYWHNVRLYNARVRRSIPITSGNAWLGLFVESWDGKSPERGTYIVLGHLTRYLLIAIWLWDWWRIG